MTAAPAAADPDAIAPGGPAPVAGAEGAPGPAPEIVPISATGAAPGAAAGAIPARGPAAAPPVNSAKVESSPPVTTTSPDGWTMQVSAKDEMQAPIAPLTTAISTREYEVSGVFNGALDGGGDQTAKGIFEVGYQIGCGIDMSTANGVSMTGTAGINPSIGLIGLDFTSLPIEGLLPGIGANIGGGITVGLKPGIINTVAVTKKQYESNAPWVSINKLRIKIDGCVGESFIRSFAVLAKSNADGDAILSWYGVTKRV
ncbi:MspA family porin [Mycolicibacterium sp.]|uniref:MspA family porin n=1 Tax=Mycolicibacterium sp. TaxID=2320850 RepID=UPI0028A6B491|nr:MspA family porin [Mycolicibacterium sp.]